MNGIVFSILCAFCIALSQLSLRKSYQQFQPSVAFLFDAIFGLFLWVPLAVFMGLSQNVSWPQAFLFAIISAILSEAIVFFSLSKGEFAVTTTVLTTYPVYTILFSRMLNNEVLQPMMYVFAGLAIAGSLIASLPDRLEKKEFRNFGIVWPFIAAICIGLSDTISKGYINTSGDFSFLFALGFIQIPVALAYLRIEKQSVVGSIQGVINDIKSYKFALFDGLFNIIGTGFLWLSFSFAPASIASPITGSNGALTVIFSKFVFKEKISARKYLGIFLAFVGVIGIALSRT